MSMTEHSTLLYFKTSPAIIRLEVMRYIRFLLSLRNVEYLLHVRRTKLSQLVDHLQGAIPSKRAKLCR